MISKKKATPVRNPEDGAQPPKNEQPGSGDASAKPDPDAGLDREVGDLGDEGAEENDGALPGRVGGGLAGG